MPRLSHSLPKYRKHTASGQAVVTLNSRDHYLGPHGTKASKAQYDRLIAEWLQCDRYYGSVLPRALAARVANGANGSAATNSGDEDFTPEDLADFRRFDQAREKLYAKGIDAQLVR